MAQFRQKSLKILNIKKTRGNGQVYVLENLAKKAISLFCYYIKNTLSKYKNKVKSQKIGIL